MGLEYSQTQTTVPAGNGENNITPSDTEDLANLPRELYIGTGGSLRVTMAGNGAVLDLANVPSGTRLPYIAERIWQSGTTASDIVAVW